MFYFLLIISQIVNTHQDPLIVIGDENVTRRSSTILQPFSKLSINGPFYCHVTWVDNKQTIDIDTDENIHPYVIVMYRKDTLKIVMQSDGCFKFTEMNIYINIHSTIREIFLAGVSTLHSANVLKINHLLKLHTEDTSSLILQLEVSNLDAVFLSAGTTKLIGYVKNKAVIQYYGIADVDASKLVCKFVDLNANGFGTVWTTGTKCIIRAEGMTIVRYNCTIIYHTQVTGLARIIPAL